MATTPKMKEPRPFVSCVQLPREEYISGEVAKAVEMNGTSSQAHTKLGKKKKKTLPSRSSFRFQCDKLNAKCSGSRKKCYR